MNTEQRNAYRTLKFITTASRRRLTGKIARVLGTAYIYSIDHKAEFTALTIAKQLGEKVSSNTSKYLREAVKNEVLSAQEVRGTTHYRFKYDLMLSRGGARVQKDTPLPQRSSIEDTAHVLTPAYIYAYLRLDLEQRLKVAKPIHVLREDLLSVVMSTFTPYLRVSGCVSSMYALELGLKRVVSDFIQECLNDKKCKFLKRMGGRTKNRILDVKGDVHPHWQEAYKVARLHRELRTLSRSGGYHISNKDYHALVTIRMEYCALLARCAPEERKKLYNEAVNKMKEILNND